MSTIITAIDRHSPAERAGVQVCEQLLSINGHPIVDVLDYRFYGYDPLSHLELKTAAGNVRHVTCRKAEGQDLGLNFDTYLMDEMRSCANHCLFCFVDQMPPGMRSTLYFKDDDARLSFLLGNYITLTGKADRIDPVFRTLQVGDTVVPFEDLVELSGEGIMEIDQYLGISED